MPIKPSKQKVDPKVEEEALKQNAETARLVREAFLKTNTYKKAKHRS